ncbi:MAG: hypothetical protein AB7I27_06450 [Bacteriovoracaceae bacterium]
MKDYSDLSELTDKKLRTLRNNLNNRLEAFKTGSVKNLPPSHMLHGLEEGDCKSLLQRVHTEMKDRAKG